MSLTRILAKVAIETRSEEITESALNAARKMLLDTIGTTIAGRIEPGIEPVIDMLREESGAKQASLLGYPDRLPLANAVFANSAMAHALDLDDVHLPTSQHIMSLVVPVTINTAEREDLDARAMLDALILGTEVACRLGRAYGKRGKGRPRSGYLPSSVVGGFGATAAAARLLGLNVEQTVNALGMFYAQAAGNRQALHDLSLTKRLQPAFAARSAIWSAELARRGVTGAINALEGQAGLFHVYLDAEPPGPEEFNAPLGPFWIERDSVKRYASCGAAHAVTDAALRIARGADFEAADIERVEIYLGPGGNLLVSRPFEMGPFPQVNTQFSAPYGVALALVHRTGDFRLTTDQAIRNDAEVADLARRVIQITKLETELPDLDVPEDMPNHTAKQQFVTVTLKDGRRFQEFSSIMQVLDPESMGFDDVADKFRDCASHANIFGNEHAEALIASICDLDEKTKARGLVRMLVQETNND